MFSFPGDHPTNHCIVLQITIHPMSLIKSDKKVQNGTVKIPQATSTQTSPQVTRVTSNSDAVNDFYSKGTKYGQFSQNLRKKKKKVI